jgi:adenosylmethionine-8-amino-7-oxononanoate aminotransferase
MSPPLTITRQQIDEMIGILRQGIEMAMQDCIDEGIWSLEQAS